MKKFYLLTLSALTAIAVNAQKNGPSVKKQKVFAVEQQPNQKPANTEKATIWESDFSDAADWAIAHDAADCSLDFSIGSVSCAGTYAIGDIASTTASNGWAMVDSDLYGGATGGNEVEDSWLTMAVPVDLTAYPNVIIEFETFYQAYSYEKPFIVVGVGDGAGNVTWPTDLNPDYDESTNPNVYAALPANVDNPTANPYKVQIDISAAAGGQSEVYIRFNWTGTWGYAWFIDDFKILEQPENDVVLNTEVFVGVNNEGIEYGRTPITQLDDSYEVAAYGVNFGSTTQTNVAVAVDFGSISYNYAVGDVLSTDEIVVSNIETPTLAVGLYEGTYTVSSTEEVVGGDNYGNNSLERNFEVTTDVYSQDGIDVQPASILSLGSLGSNSFSTELSNTVLAAMYHMRETENQVNGIQIALANNSAEGAELTISIIDTAVFLADGIGAVTGINGNYAESGIYALTADDIANGYANIFFDAPVTLAPSAYFFAANCYYIEDQAVRVLDDQTVTQPWYASMIHLVTDGLSYSNGNALAIRVLSGSAGIEETENNIFNVYPNPAIDVINVTFTENFNGSVSILNVTGKEVMTSTVNGAQHSVSTDGLSSGVYYVKVNDGMTSQIAKVVVKK
ncbi:T9SS type A sorting domain-containing protein [Crocinitomicaceae bacterium]|nr:T9SS type A sorting domain-containing protein [Crocinitomicaceae bacterium]MDC0302347.1 T9SS type A sorting domain-containing protein [bacterium]